jgi:hypothetical protein
MYPKGLLRANKTQTSVSNRVIGGMKEAARHWDFENGKGAHHPPKPTLPKI